jgi:hypothetical protein
MYVTKMTPGSIKLLTKSIAGTALTVGSLIIGNRYYSTYTYNLDENINKIIKDTYQVKQVKNENNIHLKSFIIDRLIDSDCNGKTLSIGINGNKNNDECQGIRYGEDNIKFLKSFIKNNDEIIYEFEDNYILKINKINNKLIYTFQKPGELIIKAVPEIFIKNFKTINMTSTELDRVFELK